MSKKKSDKELKNKKKVNKTEKVKKPYKKTSRKKSISSHSGGYYVASANSDKFHYPSCASAKRIKSYNKITFSSRSQAVNAGYSSCARCHP